MPGDLARIWAVNGFVGGLVTNHPAHNLDPDQSPNTQNLDPSSRVTLKKRHGSSNFTGNLATADEVRGLGIFTFENGTNIMLAKVGTSVYDITAGNWATALGGFAPSASGEVSFAIFKNEIVMVSDEGIAPHKLVSPGTGPTVALGGTPPASKFVASHLSRLWLFNTASFPSRANFSALNNHEDWTTSNDAGNFEIAPGDGYVINGVASDGDVLYVSKASPTGEEGALYAIFGSNPSDFSVRRVAHFGAMNQRCIIPTHNFVVFASPKGLYGVQGTDLIWMSEAVNNLWDGGVITAFGAAERARSAVGRFGDQVWWSAAFETAAAVNESALVVDLYKQCWNKYLPVQARIFATHPDGRIFGGLNNGSTVAKVIQYNNLALGQDEGVDISCAWETPDIDFGSWFSDKKLLQTHLHVGSATQTYTLQAILDNAAQTGFEDTFPSGGARVRRFVSRQAFIYCKFIRFRITFSGAATPKGIEIHGIEVESDLHPRSRGHD